MRMLFSGLLLVSVFFICGCTTAYSPEPLSINHPANPAAPEAPPPPASRAFLTEGGFAAQLSLTLPAEPGAHRGVEHGGHR